MMEPEKTYYKNRELSWLQFNERVLHEAANPNVPLAERLSFISIYQSNLDEFFMVRVGSLMAQMHSDEKVRENKTNMTSQEQVRAILKCTAMLEREKAMVYEQLMGELEPQGVRLVNFQKLSAKEGQFLEAYFDSHIVPFVFPLMVEKKQPIPFLNNREQYAVVVLENKKKIRLGIIPCESKVFKRLIEIPTRPGTFMLSEDLILHFAAKLFPKYKVVSKSLMRITRNADIDAASMYDEDLDYRDMMEKLLKKRRRMSPVRLEFSRDISDKAKELLCKQLHLDKKHVLKVSTPLDLSFVFKLQSYLREKGDKNELFYARRSPRLSANIDIKEKLIPQIEKKDLLLHYPFESIRPFLQLLNEAAEDPDVVSIRMTLYRLADRSKVVDALIEAAENGKEVMVLLELRARFDEAHNIDMSHLLEDAGCHVIYGLDDYKVHSKLCLITRKSGENIQYITQIGTGNYNEKTSMLYTDLCLITADQQIGHDAAEVFNALQRGDAIDTAGDLLVAPKCLREPLIAMMDAEIEKAKNGREGYIGAKLNSLTDKVIIDKLVEASQAGVRVELIVRGICCLIPGIPGYTENITVISVVGRFLEHSRIYILGSGEETKVYISSADFMTRNTIRRVEVAVPIKDGVLKERIRTIFNTVFQDDEKGKLAMPDGSYRDRELHSPKLNTQELFYQQAYDALQDKT